MSIKEQIDYAKDELTQDEKLLAGLIKIERFYKKNRVAIIALAVILLFGAVGYMGMEYYKNKRLEAANRALLTLSKSPDDASALKLLKENDPQLAELFELKKAVGSGDIKSLESLSGSEDAVVSDLAAYHLGAWKRDAEKLKGYRMRSEALLRDFALFDEAYLLMKEGRIEEGAQRLSMIESDSPLKAVAQMLEHYGVAKSKKGGE